MVRFDFLSSQIELESKFLNSIKNCCRHFKIIFYFFKFSTKNVFQNINSSREHYGLIKYFNWIIKKNFYSNGFYPIFNTKILSSNQWKLFNFDSLGPWVNKKKLCLSSEKSWQKIMTLICYIFSRYTSKNFL